MCQIANISDKVTGPCKSPRLSSHPYLWRRGKTSMISACFPSLRQYDILAMLGRKVLACRKSYMERYVRQVAKVYNAVALRVAKSREVCVS